MNLNFELFVQSIYLDDFVQIPLC